MPVMLRIALADSTSAPSCVRKLRSSFTVVGPERVQLRHRELTAEVVERDAHAALVQLAQRGDRVGEVVHDRVLADLDADAAGVGTGRVEDREDAARAVVAHQQPRRHGDPGDEIGIVPSPRCHVGGRGGEHPLVDLLDHAGRVRDRDERLGLEQAARRMVPAHAAFEAGDAAGVERCDRPVPELELAALDREPQIVPELTPIGEAEIEVGAEELDPALPRVLRLVHRGVGAREQRLRGSTSVPVETATPMLMPIVASASGSAIGSPIAVDHALRDVRRDRSTVLDVFEEITNSSPPKRATVSYGRTWFRSRTATSASTASPASCPNTSLTSLNPSRSQ